MRTFALLLALCASVIWFAGCNSHAPEADKPAPSSGKSEESSTEHAHKAGAHGGNIVPIGRDNYHAEAVFEKGGTVRLYTLGADEARVLDVEVQVLSAFARAEGGTEAIEVTFRPAPQPGDAEGKTSQFLGKLPAELAGRAVEITMPSIRIAGERFRFAFTSAADHSDGMPTALAEAEERELYLTPGGKYTMEDIAANGNVTAARKFQGLKASHDLRPRPGDAICPVTLTKANAAFTWIIGGQAYQFCCPPCVDEFVKTAKEQPDAVKEPSAYVKSK